MLSIEPLSLMGSLLAIGSANAIAWTGLPDHDIVLESNLRVRQWRVVNAHACGPESWGMASATAALEAYARVARDQSDRGAIATMDEYAYRPLKAKVAEIKGRQREAGK